ncbi:MAG: hypothetical protein WC758_06205 [Candidatus Woesearchaeota archaeon]
MATFLDIGVLSYFRVIFAMILIFVIMYGFLSWSKPFGDGSGLYALISIAFAILSITSKGVLSLITFMTPWFFVIVFIAFFILFMLMIFGLKKENLTAGMSSELRTWVIIITIVILLFGLGSAFGQNTLDKGTGGTSTDTSSDISVAQGSIGTGDNTTGAPEATASNDFSANMLNTLVNPQVLGMILILLIGVFAVFLLTKGFL